MATAKAWEGAGSGAQVWHTSLHWAGEGTTVSPVAMGQWQGVGVPYGHRDLPCPQSIETLRVDGSGRHSFPAVLRSHTEPLGLAVFESRFFWTDGTELVSASQAAPQEHAVLLRAPISAFTVLHALQQPPREYPLGTHDGAGLAAPTLLP